MNNGAKQVRPDHRGDKYPPVTTGLNWCLTDRCRRTVDKKKEHSPYCWKCRWRIRKEKNPLRYAFGNLRRRAKQRGKEFLLTFEEYRRFAVESGYAFLKGKNADCLSIDRIDNDGPYAAWNIEAKTVSMNARKGQRKQFVPYFARQMESVAYKPTEEEIAEIQNQL